jgi:hypothetical protein
MCRAFFRGPFKGAWVHGLGGLLESGRGLGAALFQEEARTRARVILDVGLGPDVASEVRDAYLGRFRAAMTTITESPLGRLMGLDKAPASAKVESTLLAWESRLDTETAALGLFDTVAGEVSDIAKHVPVQ